MEITKPKSYSEAELLRIYVVDSYCIRGHKRHAESPPEELEQVCEYLCMDGPPVPELDLEDYKEWLTMDEYGFLSLPLI
ncbi:hypothetical protein ACLB2K_008731 [Fragaria x ananassa]